MNANELVKTRIGRIVLHAVCLVRDRKLSWHVAGIAREIRGI
jgi:hypothetical protein